MESVITMEKINPHINKINAIKALRQFCLDTYGIDPGLRISKDFVEAIPKPKLTPEEVLKTVNNLPDIWLTGSRFFKTDTVHSDWDFFTGRASVSSLAQLGFVRIPFHDYLDQGTEEVWQHVEANIHVQIVKDTGHKLLARDRIFGLMMAGFCLPTSKEKKRRIWDFALNQTRPL